MLAELTESMESSSVPCLIEKALSMLISMGSHGRPKPLKKLENVLRPCTMVAPYVDPLEALEIANRRSQHLEPHVLNVQHNKVKVSYSGSNPRSDNDFQTSVFMNAQESGRDYDLALPGGETHDEITRNALAWLSEWETREGTQEQLVQGFFERCQKKVDRGSFEIISRLQSRGFLKVNEEKVSYSLPEFDSEQSRILEDFRNSGASKNIFTLFHLYQGHCTGDYLIDSNTLLQNVYGVYGGFKLIDVEHWGRNNSRRQHTDESSCDDAAENHGTLRSMSRDGVEDVLRDIFVAYLLSCLPPEDRPNTLSDLINFIKPESLILAVPPSQILHKNSSRIRHRKIQITNKRGSGGGRRRSRGGQKRQERKEVVLGIAPGETSAQELIPLTPEGLLGIHAHIGTPNSEPMACVNPSEHQTTPMDSPPSWLPGDKPRANGLSKEFAAILLEQLTRRAKDSNAVPVLASQREKEETISRILEWVDAHRSPARHDDRDKVPRKLKSIKQLQREFIGLCAIRPRRIAPGTTVRCLQKSGYVTVHSGESPEVTYNITDIRTHLGPVRRDAGLAPWQQHAEEFRQSVSKCYSVYFKRAFPPGICARTPSSRTKIGKRRQRRGGACLRMNKKPKHLESSDDDDELY